MNFGYETSEKVQQIVTLIFVVIMLCIFPFVKNNGMFDITGTRRTFFMVVALIALAVIVIIQIIRFVGDWRLNRYLVKSGKKALNARPKGLRGFVFETLRLSIPDIFMLLFALAIIVSCIVSPYGSEAFLGLDHRMFGGDALLTCVAIYFIISRFYVHGQFITWIFFIVNVIIGLLVFVNFWGIDPLSIYEDMAESSQNEFTGTFGNINVTSGYFGLITVVAACGVVFAYDAKTRTCSIILLVVASLASFTSQSDSWALCVGGGLLALLGVSARHRKTLASWALAVAVFAAAAMVLGLLINANQNSGSDWIAKRVSMFSQQSAGPLLSSVKGVVAMFICAAIIFGISRLPKIGPVRRFGARVVIVLFVVAAVAAIAYAWPFDDSFGTNRGYIWRRSLWTFASYDFLHMLFGSGPNTLFQAISENYYDEMMEKFNNVRFIDAHNEAIQYLVTIGILGVVGFYGTLITLAWRAKCGWKKLSDPLLAAAIVFIVADILQSLVNNPQPITTPFLFMALGLIARRIALNDAQETDPNEYLDLDSDDDTDDALDEPLPNAA